jgi:hypothetical protein
VLLLKGSELKEVCSSTLTCILECVMVNVNHTLFVGKRNIAPAQLGQTSVQTQPHSVAQTGDTAVQQSMPQNDSFPAPAQQTAYRSPAEYACFRLLDVMH